MFHALSNGHVLELCPETRNGQAGAKELEAALGLFSRIALNGRRILFRMVVRVAWL